MEGFVNYVAAMYNMAEVSAGFVLQMGEIKVSKLPATLTCVGLGSCVGVFLYDRISKVGGGAHITLPVYDATASLPRSYYADTGLDQLLIGMQAAGADISGLRAKIVGGANVTNIPSLDVGRHNTKAVLEILAKKKIYLAAYEVGGSRGRKAIFNTYSGTVYISSEQTNFSI